MIELNRERGLQMPGDLMLGATPEHPTIALRGYESQHRPLVELKQRAVASASRLIVPSNSAGIVARNVASRAFADRSGCGDTPGHASRHNRLMTDEALTEQIVAARESFRWAGRQYGDDACWLDVEKVFEDVIPGHRARTDLPAKADCLAICTWYVTEFADDGRTPAGLPQSKNVTDADLRSMTVSEKRRELDALIAAARELCETPITERNVVAMRKFFSALPEGAEPHIHRHLAPPAEMLASCELFFSDPHRVNKLHSW